MSVRPARRLHFSSFFFLMGKSKKKRTTTGHDPRAKYATTSSSHSNQFPTGNTAHVDISSDSNVRIFREIRKLMLFLIIVGPCDSGRGDRETDFGNFEEQGPIIIRGYYWRER